MESKQIHALLIEDNPADTRLIQEILADVRGFSLRLDCSDRLSTAIKRLHETPVDVILLDLSLADSKGLDSLARLQTQAPGTPIIILTGLSDEEVAIKAIQEGAQDYLVKGRISGELLSHAISYAIERKRTEEALRESEVQYRRLFEAANDALLVADEAGRYLDANARAEELLGYRRNEILKMGLADITPPETAPMGQARYEEFKRLGRMSGEYTVVRKDGTRVEVEFSASRIGPGRYLSVLRDISERKRAEESLRRSEEKYRTLFETMAQGVVYQDPEGKITSVNPAAERILGLTLDQMQGKGSTDPRWRAIHEDGSDFPGETHPAMVALKSGEAVREVVMGVFHPQDGAYHWININAVPQFRPGEKRPYQVYTTFADITERKRAEEQLRQSEERFRQLAENISEVFWMIDPEKVEMLYVSPGYEKIWGRSCESLYRAPHTWIEAIDPGDRERVEKAISALYRSCIEQKIGTYDEEYRIIRPDGSRRWIRDRAFPIRNASGQVYRIAGIAEEISERKKAEALLQSRARRQAIIAELGQRALSGIPLPLLMNEAVTQAAETLEVEYCKILEPLPDGSALLLTAGVGWKEGLVGQATVGIWENSQAAYSLATNGPVVMEELSKETRFSTPLLLRDHGVVSGMTVLIPGLDYPYGVLGAHTQKKRHFGEEDVLFLQSIANVLAAAIGRKKAEERIEHQAYHDALTGLPNRLLFEDRLSIAVAQAQRSQQQVAILLIDLDRFKIINDTLGHHTGDELLRCVASRFLSLIRNGDTVARMGGDEFAILLPELSTGDIASDIADRIFSSLKQSFSLEGRELFVGASIGMAVYPEAGLDMQTLLRHADTALYRAKEQGRNALRSYSPTMNVRAFERLSLESSLRKALDRQEFLLHFQPQVELKTGEIIGFEALVRWSRPETGLVSPAEFIPLAEETGLIVPMGEWILHAACAQNKAWRQAGFPSMRIGVNLSARQFHRDNLVEMVTRTLKETGLDPSALELELTESILMGKEESILRMLRELAEMGVQLSIDDFGTGYSSLAYLKRFPIVKLKVDQLFVRNITTDPNDAVIAQTVVAMAHSLRLKAVAEGVETESQLGFLRSIGCDEMQGYLFSRPLPAAEATKLLVQKKRL